MFRPKHKRRQTTTETPGGMALLDNPSVLDPLSASPELSLSSKRSLSQVNSTTQAAIRKIYRSNCIHVHYSDCTVENADFLLHILLNDSLDNNNVDMLLHVKDMTRKVKLVRLHGCIQSYSYLPYVLCGEKGTIDRTTAYFLGHVFARHAYYGRDARVKLTTGEEINLREVQMTNRILQTIRGIQKMEETDRAILSGSLLRNAERRITKNHIENYIPGTCVYNPKPNKRRLDLNCLQLDDDQMHTLAPRIRGLTECIKELHLCGNCFGLHGTAMLLGDDPQHHPSPTPQWPMLEKLLFSETPIGAGCSSLCNAILHNQMPKLKTLHLCNAGLGPVEARLLFESLPNAPELEILSLSGNPIIGCDGFTPLERPPPNQIVLPSLRELNVAFSDDLMQASGYRVLAQALLCNNFPNIRSIFTSPTVHSLCVDLALEAVLKGRDFSEAKRKAKSEMAKII